MICNHTVDTLSVAAAALLVGFAAWTLSPAPSDRMMQTAQAATLASEMEPLPASTGARPQEAISGATVGAARLGGGGCGKREIRVFDAVAGEYRVRTASVCWRNIL